MRYIISIFVCIILFSGCSKKPVDLRNPKILQRVKSEAVPFEQLQYRSDNLHYEKNKDKPYTGWVIDNDVQLFQIKNGKAEGTFGLFYPDGQLKGLFSAKDGKTDGHTWEWWPNGELKLEGEFSAGKLKKLKIWNENGEKGARVTGLGKERIEIFYENGTKESEGVYENGTLRVMTQWDRSGNLELQVKYDSSGNYIQD